MYVFETCEQKMLSILLEQSSKYEKKNVNFSGQIEKRFPSGATEIVFPNGCRRCTSPSGTEEVCFPDGTMLLTNPSREEKILTLPNGQKEIHTKEHKVFNIKFTIYENYLTLHYREGNTQTGLLNYYTLTVFKKLVMPMEEFVLKTRMEI